MKPSLFHLALAVTTFSCALPLFQPAAMAQEASAADQTTTERIRIINVAPSTMAWWLDPSHQSEPITFKISRLNAEGVLPPSTIDPGKPLGDYILPEGINKIVAIDPQNVLLVQGTAAAIATLKKAIAVLDKPEQQVEVGVQYVYMDEADLKDFGVLTFNQSAEAGPFKWAVLPDQVVAYDAVKAQPVALTSQNRLQELLQKGKALIATSPSVTARNNRAVALRSTTQRPMILNSLEWPKVEAANVLVYMSSSIGINVRPTINQDETIDLVLAPGLSLQMNVPQRGLTDTSVYGDFEDPKVIAWRRQLGGVQTLRNVQDGQTILLTGQDAANILPPLTNFESKKSTTLANNKAVGSLFSKSSKFKPKKSTQLVLFVTPRIVRRLTTDKSVISTPPTT